MKDKLSQWLANEGFTSDNKKSSSSRPKTKQGKNVPAKAKKIGTTKKTTPPKNTKTHSNASPQKSEPKGAPKKFTNNDPFLHRPTVEKREKFHPTNFLPPKNVGDIRVVPLGGMEQVGENMMFLEWGNDIVIIDTGFLFPSPEHLGVDVLIPDISYLIKNKHKIRGVIYTHGHLDHIGGVPYILPELGYPPMYATRLTKELIFAQGQEHGINEKLKITEITPKSKIKLGKFEFEFFHINHSIPDGVGIVAKTPYGSVVHSSDFKFDYNPSDDQPIDLGRIAQIGKNGVALALVDSTSSMKSGHTLSESVIEETLEKIVCQARGRLIMATFASNIGRISKIIEAAERCGRTVFLSGRSMERNVAIAKKLNYLRCRENSVQRMGPAADKMAPDKVLILSTGSQGEELAALTRMAAGTHAKIKLTENDTVVFSSSPIPGNEMAIVSVLNNLAEVGVKMIDYKQMDIHVSGHAHADECKLMTSLLNPKYFAPIHGEGFMRHAHRDLIVENLQIKKERTFIMQNGQGVTLNAKGARLMQDKERVAGSETLIELGEKVHDQVLEDRKFMAENGIILVNLQLQKGKIKKLDIRARGFLYMNMEHEIFKLLEKEVRHSFERNYDPARPIKVLEKPIKIAVQKFILQKTKKEPVVEIVVNE